MNEEWRAVPGYEAVLEASSLGRVRSASRLVPCRGGKLRRTRSRILTKNPNKLGYLCIHPCYGGTVFAHRFVALAFVPNPENLPVVNHIDGVKTNNHPSNLEWCTQSENAKHAHRTGLARGMDLKKGDESIAAKLTEAQVSQVKKHLRDGTKRAVEMARELGVCKGTIGEIKAGRSWSHVECAP